MSLHRFQFSGLVLACVCGFTASVYAENEPETVKGYFCDTRQDLISFLTKVAEGETEVMAANIVNKAAGVQTCAHYLPLQAIAHEEKSQMDGGVLFRTQSFVFLPERSEKWAGATIGVFSTGSIKQDI